MLDIRFIREHPDLVQAGARKMHDMGFGFNSSFAHRLVGVHPVEPDTHGIGIIWITIGERS